MTAGAVEPSQGMRIAGEMCRLFGLYTKQNRSPRWVPHHYVSHERWDECLTQQISRRDKSYQYTRNDINSRQLKEVFLVFARRKQDAEPTTGS